MASIEMKINASVYFNLIGKPGLFLYLQNGSDEGIEQTMSFDELLADSIKTFTPEEKKKAKKKIAKSLRKFLKKLGK